MLMLCLQGNTAKHLLTAESSYPTQYKLFNWLLCCTLVSLHKLPHILSRKLGVKLRLFVRKERNVRHIKFNMLRPFHSFPLIKQ